MRALAIAVLAFSIGCSGSKNSTGDGGGAGGTGGSGDGGTNGQACHPIVAFQSRQTFSFGTPQNVQFAQVATANIDNAFGVDFVTSSASTFYILLDDAMGNYLQRQTFVAPGTIRNAVTADFNKDGFDDFFVIVNAPSMDAGAAMEAYVGLRTAPGKYAFSSIASTYFSPASGTLSINGTADFNKDGFPDIFGEFINDTATSVDEEGWILMSTGAGSFAPDPVTFNIASSIKTIPYSLKGLGDFNNDGLVDIVGLTGNGNPTGTGTGMAVVFLNRGNGNMTRGPVATMQNGFADRALDDFVVTDVDHDGNLDVVFTSTNYQFSVANGDGKGNLQYRVGFPVAPPMRYYPFIIGIDANCDGFTDMVDDEENVYLNDTHGQFPQASSYAAMAGICNSYELMAATDVNGDGKPDIVCVQATDALTYFGR